MTKGELDFVSLTKICKHCLLHVVDKQKYVASAEICSQCNDSLSVDVKTRKKLWKRQLQLFLNYKSKIGKNPDVLVLYSGGTDSTLALYLAKEKLKLNVIALMFDYPWARPEINKKADEFCSRYHIPLIRIKIDLKAIFLSCYDNVKKVSNKTIINYPWCEMMCGALGGSPFLQVGIQYVTRLLKIERVITGNNFAFFRAPVTIIKNPKTKLQRFINKYNKLFYLTSILGFDLEYNHMVLYLPIACGYNRNKKTETLSKIGFSLPEHYFRTPGSDCQLSVLLPCTHKLLTSELVEPRASAYLEFLSGYLTREEWYEQIIKTNNFTDEDSKEAMEVLRHSLVSHTSNDIISITFNDVFFKKMHNFDEKYFKFELTKHLQEKIYGHYYKLGKHKKAITEVRKAIKSDNKNSVYYEILGASYTKTKQYKEAIGAFKKAEKLNPEKEALNFSLARCYRQIGQINRFDEELKKAMKKRSKELYKIEDSGQ